MSYILDALKKSDKERRRGSVPDVLTVQEPTVQEPKRRMRWSYLVIGALLLNAGIFIWWAQSKKPARVGQAVVQKQEYQSKVEAPRVPLNEKKEIRKDVPPAQKQISKIAESPAPAVVEKPVAPVKASVEKSASVEPPVKHEGAVPAPAPPAAAQPALSEPKPAETAIPQAENKTYNVTELPPVLRQSLPQLTISTHIHSNDPASRLVRINGQTFREGQAIDSGLKLEEITSDGIILRYHDYRFRLGVR